MLETIYNRKSVRRYTNEKISDEIIQKLLEAGMSGPSATNARPWSFVVVNDEKILNDMAIANMKYAEPLRNSQLAILVCGDLDRSCLDFWVIDCSIAAQNMTLAAEELGLGSVWLGVWPVEERVNNQAKLFNLPEKIVPHSILVFGYPDDEVSKKKTKKIWEEGRVHYNVYK